MEWKPRSRSVVVLAAGTAFLASGCASLRTLVMKNSPSEAPVPPIPASVELVDQREQAVLAAVEGFLDRTRDYQLPPAPAAIEPARGLDRGLTRPPQPQAPTATLVSARETGVVANAQVTLGEVGSERPKLALPVVQAVSIRTIERREVSAANPPKTSTTNEPLDVRASETEVSVDRFVQHLQTRAEEAGDFDTEWRLRFVQLAFDRTPTPRTGSSSLGQDAGRILNTLIRVAEAARAAAGNPMLVGEEALMRVDELQQVLADRADPIISTIALCRKVVTFGVYEDMPAEAIVAGRTAQTIVYSEIRNLRAEQTDNGQYRTLLGTRVEILTADGTSVWQREEPEITDLCRRRRSDFFVAQRISLPATLSAGEYVLKLYVEDKLSGKANEATHRFTVTAQEVTGTTG